MKLRLPLLLAAVLMSAYSYQSVSNSAEMAWKGGAGTWDTSALDWNSGAAAWNNATNKGDTAVFGGTGGKVSLVDGSTIELLGLKFSAAGYEIAGGTLNFGAQQGLIDSSALSNETNNSTTISSNLTGTNGVSIAANGDLTATGGGSNSRLILSGDNTGLTGNIHITSGSVAFTNSKAAGSAETTAGSGNKIVLSNGGGIVHTNIDTTAPALGNDIEVTSTGGTIRVWGNQTLTLNGEVSGSGTLSKTDNGQLVLANLNTGVFTGALSVGAGTIRLADISGTGTLTKTGGATLALANRSSSFAGDVVVSSGTLQLGHSSTMGSTATFNFLGKSISVENAMLSICISNGGTSITGTYNFPALTEPISITNGTFRFLGEGGGSSVREMTGDIKFSGASTISHSGGGYTQTDWIKGAITGDGTLTFTWSGGGTNDNYRTLHINDAAHNYTGEIILASADRGVIMNLNQALGEADWTINNANWTVRLSNTEHVMKSLNSSVVAKIQGNGANSILNVGSGDGDSVFAGILGESGATNMLSLVKTGTGSLTLSGENTYKGDTTVKEGVLVAEKASSIGTGDVVVESLGTLKVLDRSVIKGDLTLYRGGNLSGLDGGSGLVYTLGAGEQLELRNGTTPGAVSNLTGGLSFTGGGSMNIQFSSLSESAANIAVSGGLQFAGSTDVEFFDIPGTITDAVIGDYVLFTANSMSGYNNTSLNLTTPTGMEYYLFGTFWNESTKSLYLRIASPLTVYWNVAGGGNWDNASAIWENAIGGSASFADGKTAIFNDLGQSVKSHTITLTDTINAESIQFNNSADTYTIASNGSGVLTGSTSITKKGSGDVAINMANSISGTVTLQGGQLIVGATNALGTGAVVMDGGGLVLTSNYTLNNSGYQITNGTIVYRDNNNFDLSGMITGSGNITVDIAQASHQVAWTGKALNQLDHNITKNGAGTFEADVNGAFNKNLAISAGKLLVNLSGSASINLANVSGSGQLELNNGASTTLSGESSAFAGPLTLKGGTFTLSNLATLNNTSLVTLDGTTISATGGKTTSASIQIAAAGATFTGAATDSYTLSGALTGSGTLSFDNSTYNLTGNLSAYTGNMTLANDATVVFGNGGAATLSGGKFIQSASLSGSGTYKVNYSNADITLAANLSGSAGLTQSGSGKLTLTGTNTTSGLLKIESGSVQIGDGTTDGSWSNASAISGAGKLIVKNTTTDLDLAGLTGGLELEHSGQALVDLSGTSGYTGEVSLKEGGTLNLTATDFDNKLTINKGTLTNGSSATNVYISSNGLVELGGVAATAIKQLDTTTEDGFVKGIAAGDITLAKSSLAFGEPHLSTIADSQGAPKTGEAIIQFTDGSTSSLNLDEIKLSVQEDTSLRWLLDNPDMYALEVTNGTLNYSGTLDHASIFEGVALSVMQAYGIMGIEGGAIILDGRKFEGPFAVWQDDAPKTIGALDQGLINRYHQVYVEGTLNLNLADGEQFTIKELAGNLTTGQINLGQAGSTVILSNSSTNEDDGSDMPNEEGQKTHFDSQYLGNISGQSDIVKVGTGKLTLGSLLSGRGGNVQTTGDMTVAEGSLVIVGQTVIGGTTIVDSGATLTLTNLTTGSLDVASGSGLNLNGGWININGVGMTSQIADDSTIQNLNGIRLDSGTSLNIGNNVNIGTATLDWTGTNITLDTGIDITISQLNGTGVIKTNGQDVILSNSGASTWTGTFEGSGSTLIKNGTGAQTIRSAGNAAMDIIVNSGLLTLGQDAGSITRATTAYGDMTVNGGELQIAENMAANNLMVATGGSISMGSSNPDAGAPPATLNVSNATFQSGATLNTVIPNPAGAIAATGIITLPEQMNLKLVNSTSYDPGSATQEYIIMTGDGGYLWGDGAGTGADIASGTVFNNWDVKIEKSLALFYSSANVYLDADSRTVKAAPIEAGSNKLLEVAQTDNALAGANLLWNAGLQTSGSTLDNLLSCIMDRVDEGNNGAASRMMAASVGSTYISMLSATQEGLRQQQTLVRNRMTGMGLNQAYVYNDLPLYNMWVQGIGGHSKLKTRGDDSGYENNTWGGIVGFDMNITPAWTIGAAFSASYGDLKSNAADSLSGDLDMYYVNLFAQYKRKNWTHALILTGAWGEADVDRTVTYCDGLYRGSSKADTSSYGLMYEGTYDFALNKERTSILQPLVNISIAHNKVDSFTESGAGNASLNVKDLDATTGSISAGARWLGLIGSNVLGRESVGELRAQIVQDLGSDHATGDVSYMANPNSWQRVRGAKVGSTGIQVGAGVTIPVGQQGNIFLDANVDLRSHMTSANGSIGYRYNF